jgi:hypothetical protein
VKGPFIGVARRRNGQAFSRELRREGVYCEETVAGEINARKKKLTRSDCWGPHVSEAREKRYRFGLFFLGRGLVPDLGRKVYPGSI